MRDHAAHGPARCAAGVVDHGDVRRRPFDLEWARRLGIGERAQIGRGIRFAECKQRFQPRRILLKRRRIAGERGIDNQRVDLGIVQDKCLIARRRQRGQRRQPEAFDHRGHERDEHIRLVVRQYRDRVSRLETVPAQDSTHARDAPGQLRISPARLAGDQRLAFGEASRSARKQVSQRRASMEHVDAARLRCRAGHTASSSGGKRSNQGRACSS